MWSCDCCIQLIQHTTAASQTMSLCPPYPLSLLLLFISSGSFPRPLGWHDSDSNCGADVVGCRCCAREWRGETEEEEEMEERGSVWMKDGKGIMDGQNVCVCVCVRQGWESEWNTPNCPVEGCLFNSLMTLMGHLDIVVVKKLWQPQRMPVTAAYLEGSGVGCWWVTFVS